MRLPIPPANFPKKIPPASHHPPCPPSYPPTPLHPAPPPRYDTAALAGGYSIDDPAEFAARVTAMMGGNIGAPAAKETEAKAEPKAAEEEEEATVEVVE